MSNNQYELKIAACDAAYQLIQALVQIQDEDFVNDIIYAVSDNSEYILADLMDKA